MSDDTSDGLRERLARSGEETLGRLAQDLLENPLVSGAIARAFEAREKASQAQELAMGALNIPSAADLERLTRRLRSVSQRLEGIEDGVDRLDERIAGLGGQPDLERRLDGLADRLVVIEGKLDDQAKRAPAAPRGAARRTEQRLEGIEGQLASIAKELAALQVALPGAPDPLPRGQERLQVES